MPAANYNAAVLANGAAGENVMLLTARWDETTPAPACGQFYMLRAWKAEEAVSYTHLTLPTILLV